MNAKRVSEREWFGQGAYSVRHEWGRDGARRASERGDVVVIVDVLRFSTTVVAAVANGWWIRPCANEGEVLQAELSGDIADGEGAAVALSPLYYTQPPNPSRPTVVALQSLNGASCSLAAGAGTVWAGALVNANLIGEQLTKSVMDGCLVTVVSCGERWEEPGEDGPLRFAAEDYIGAGAIMNAVRAGSKSPEAVACEGAFHSVREELEKTLLACGSGIELVDKGREEDVRSAARLNSIPVIPGLIDGVYVLWCG